MTDVEALRGRLTGRLVTPADEGWEATRRGFALAVDQRPAAVVEVAGVEDVRAAVRFGAEHGVPVAAQRTGHSPSTLLDGTLLLRTAALDTVQVDTAAGVARVGAGATWGDVLPKLAGTGLVALAGSTGTVGVVGYSLGAGLSWFGRRYGSATQAVRAVELVDAAGVERRVTDDSDPDLMWALRGGGGDFGVVTALELDLYPQPSLAGGRITFDIADAPAVLARYAEVTTGGVPDELSAWVTLMHFPPLPDLPAEIRGRSFAMVDTVTLGSSTAAASAVASLRAAATPLSDTTGPLGIEALPSVTQEPTEPSPALAGGVLLPGFGPKQVDGLLAAAGSPADTPLMFVEIRHLEGAFRRAERPGVGATVSAPYMALSAGMAPPPAPLDPVYAAMDAVTAALGSDGRTVLTFASPRDPIGSMYGAADVERLRAVKASVDPAGLIRSNVPVNA